jgi:hypothetical protein
LEHFVDIGQRAAISKPVRRNDFAGWRTHPAMPSCRGVGRPQQAAPPEEFAVPPAPVAAVLPAAPIVAPPVAAPEQPEGPTPF